MKEFKKVNSGWVKRFDRLYVMMQSDIIYMESILRKRTEKDSKATILEVRVNDSPYPTFETGEDENTFSRNVLEWMGSSVELHIVESEYIRSKTIMQIWEPCGFATMMTVYGNEVLVGTNHRASAKTTINRSKNMDDWGNKIGSFRLKDEDDGKCKQVHIEFSKMLSMARSEYQDDPDRFIDEKPPIREKFFRADDEEFIKQMELDDLF